jgi:hypothetical protein
MHQAESRLGNVGEALWFRNHTEPVPNRDDRKVVLTFEATEGGAGVLTRLAFLQLEHGFEASRERMLEGWSLSHWIRFHGQPEQCRVLVVFDDGHKQRSPGVLGEQNEVTRLHSSDVENVKIEVEHYRQK